MSNLSDYGKEPLVQKLAKLIAKNTFESNIEIYRDNQGDYVGEDYISEKDYVYQTIEDLEFVIDEMVGSDLLLLADKEYAKLHIAKYGRTRQKVVR